MDILEKMVSEMVIRAGIEEFRSQLEEQMGVTVDVRITNIDWAKVKAFVGDSKKTKKQDPQHTNLGSLVGVDEASWAEWLMSHKGE